MGLLTKFANKVGLVTSSQVAELNKEITELKTKSSAWSTLFNISQEWRLWGDKVVKPYEQIASVYKAVKAIADNVPQADLIFRDKKSKKLVDDEIVGLFNNPNPFMTETDFIQAWVGFFCLYGESMVIKETSLGQLAGTRKLPAELWVFNPIDFQEVTDNCRTITSWRYNKEGRLFTPEEVIFMRDFNPYSLFRGMAPTKPIEKVIDIDWQTLIFNKAFFENNATPGLTLSTEQRLNQEIVDRLRNQIEQRHQGASKAFKVAIFEAGLKALDVSSTHKEMEFIEQKRFSREEIYGIWKVPKAMFSITDDLNYATFIGQMKMFWNYTIMPALKKIESAINTHMVNDYNSKIEAAFDLTQVVAYQEDFKEKIDTATKLFAMGFTRNEINKKLELEFEDQPWGDVWWIPFGQVPADPENAGNSLDLLAVDDTDKSPEGLRRLTTWQTFIVKHAPLENRFASSIKRHFFEQRKEVLEKLNNLGPDTLNTENNEIKIDWTEQDEKLKDRAKQYILLGLKEGVNFGKAMLNRKDAKDFNDDALNAKIINYLIMRADKITMINDTIKNQIKNSLAEGIQAGETILQLSDRVRDIYNMAAARSLLIARTETTGAVNGGSSLYYESAGVKKKEWLTARDNAVRHSHRTLDGQKVGLNDDFSNGLAFPGDMKGPPEETCNCRCTLIPVVE